MAENDKKISQFGSSNTFPIGSLILASLEDQNSESGYSSFKIESSVVASQMLGAYGFPLALTKTAAKTILGALEEIAYKTLTGTLTAGQTSVTISDAAITTTSDFVILYDKYSIAADDVTVTTGSMTFTFSEALSTDLHIKVRIS